MTFTCSNRAQINVGIPTAIWAINPFFTACLDYLFTRTPLKRYQIVGMAIMLAGAATISLSQVFMKPNDASIESKTQYDEYGGFSEKKRMPVVVPIMVAFLMPIVCSFFILFIKDTFVSIRPTPMNWTFAYNLIFSLILTVAGILKFCLEPGFFKFNYFMLGTVSSAFNTAGCLFSQMAIATGSPLGPIQALQNTQMVVLTLISAVATATFPNLM